jgi:hypothetical protein
VAPVYHNFIDGREVAASTGGAFKNRNAANHDDLIGVFRADRR